MYIDDNEYAYNNNVLTTCTSKACMYIYLYNVHILLQGNLLRHSYVKKLDKGMVGTNTLH